MTSLILATCVWVATLVDEPSPAPPPGAEVLARRLESLMKAGDWNSLNEHFPFEGLAARVSKGIDPRPKELDEYLLGVRDSFERNGLIRSRVDNTSVRFLRIRMQHGEAHAVFRALGESHEYFELVFARETDTLQVVDMYTYTSGLYVSELLQRFARDALIPEDQGGQRGEIARHFSTLQALYDCRRSGSRRFMTLYDSLPPRLQRRRMVLIERLLWAAETSEEELGRATEAILEAFPDDPRLGLPLFEGLIVLKKFDLAVERLNAMRQTVGDDAYVTYMEGVVRSYQDDYEQAEVLFHRAAKQEPDLVEPWEALFEYSISDGEHDESLRFLQKLRSLGWKTELKDEKYAEFLATPGYQAWLQESSPPKKAPSDARP